MAVQCARHGGETLRRPAAGTFVRRYWSLLLVAAIVVACASPPRPDAPAVGPPLQTAPPPTLPVQRELGYQLAQKYRPWQDATVVEYGADLSGAGRFIAYYVFDGQQPPPQPPALVHLGCVLGTAPGRPVGRSGARLRATVDGVALDFGLLDYQPGAGADAYWRENVPYAEARQLAGTAVQLDCAGLEFALSPRQVRGLHTFFSREGGIEH